MLLEQLRDLGKALPVSASPTVADLPVVVAGLVHYTETGSLVPPVVVEPTPVAIANQEAEASKVAQLESQIADLQRQNAASAAGPAAVLPPPSAPAPAQPSPEPAPSPAAPEAPAPAAPPVSAVPSAPAS